MRHRPHQQRQLSDGSPGRMASPTGTTGALVEGDPGPNEQPEYMCDSLFMSLHTFRPDQMLRNDEILKSVPPLGPIVPIEPPDDETPRSISGLVHTRRRVVGDAVEERRELCAAELFDAVLSDGGALLGGDLLQG